MADVAKEKLAFFDRLKSLRYNWDSQWQEIRELIRTSTSNFNRSSTQGDRRTENIFDGTAPWALEQLAAGLNSFLSSPTDRWFNIGLDENEELTDEQLLWCEQTADDIYKEYAMPEVNLNPMLHESYLDVAGFGTAVLYQDWNWDKRHVSFRSFPLADCYILENNNGIVDVLYRQIVMQKRQIMQEFSLPDDNIPQQLKDERDDLKTFTVMHCTEPRVGVKAGPGKRNKPFASYWIIRDFNALVRESGYDEFPYHVPRWTKLAGESYGRSPGMTCMPDVKMLNVMSKVVIKAAQKIIDPPLIVPDDGFILPIKTAPASLIFKTAGQEDTIKPLETKGRIDIGNDMMNQRREQILKAFYVDWIVREKKKERQTAAEVYDDRNEMLRQMAPMLGRLQVELHSPMLKRTFNLKMAAGQIRPAPASMHGRQLHIYYVSPAAKAQTGAKAANIQAFTQDIVTFAQGNPEIMDAIDTDAYAQEMAKFRDVSRRIIRTPELIASIRSQRQQVQAAQQLAATGKDTASAIKDLSIAQQNGLPVQ